MTKTASSSYSAQKASRSPAFQAAACRASSCSTGAAAAAPVPTTTAAATTAAATAAASLVFIGSATRSPARARTA
ncbi:MAG: hypothetical protein MUF27_17625, partial [Acidobacteria bacterium]|nr:hypothetical protein [Acidobacteriota bacterium]